MTVSKVGFQQWHSSLTGRTYDSELAAKKYDNEMRMASRPESEGSKILNKLTTEQLKSLVTEMTNLADQPAGRMAWTEIQQEFVDTHPEFFACEYNAGSLSSLLVERGKLTRHGEFIGTMTDIETAHCDLAERNVLLRKQGTPLPKRPIDEAAMYELPFEELHDKARGW